MMHGFCMKDFVIIILLVIYKNFNRTAFYHYNVYFM